MARAGSVGETLAGHDQTSLTRSSLTECVRGDVMPMPNFSDDQQPGQFEDTHPQKPVKLSPPFAVSFREGKK